MSALYKFIADPEAVRFLLSGVIKFTPISELNDPSELNPTLNREEVVASLERLRRDGYSDKDLIYLRQQGHLLRLLAPHYQAIRVPVSKEKASQIVRSPFYDSIPRLERLLSETAREMAAKVGLFCLSKRFDSLPMWAHYAANAMGLVVEFCNLDQVFQGDETGILRKVTPVKYQREMCGVTFDPQSHEALFFAKYQDWSYEQELRVVLPLSECQTHFVGGRQLFLYNIPSTCIARIILGWHMSSEAKATVQRYVSELNASVEIAHAQFTHGKVRNIQL
jgi:hypothetical protein